MINRGIFQVAAPALFLVLSGSGGINTDREPTRCVAVQDHTDGGETEISVLIEPIVEALAAVRFLHGRTLPAVEDPLRKGIEYLESKRYGEARQLFQSIADKEKGNHQALFYLGKVDFLENKFPSSIEWLEKAVQIQPLSSLYHYWLARANEAQFQKAGMLNKLKYGKRFRDEILRAVELDGNNPDARFWLMTFFLTSPRSFGGDWNKALEQAEAIKKIDLAYGHHALITAYVRAEKFDLAEKELAERIGNFPDRIEHKIDLSWFFLDRKNYPRAIQNSLDILNSHPDAAVALFQIGRAAAESGTQRELGKRSLSQYIADKPPAGRPFLEWAHFYMGAILASEGDTEGARSEYSKALQIVPDFNSAALALKKLPKRKIQYDPLKTNPEFQTENRFAVHLSRRGLIPAVLLLAAAASPPCAQAEERGSGGQQNPRGSVKGRVVDGTTQQPLKGAKVRLLGSGQSETTDDQGAFMFRELAVGPYTLEAALLNFRTSIKPDVIVKSGRTTEVQVEMDLSILTNEVVVQGSVFEGTESGRSGASFYSAEEIRRSPGSLGDINRILRGLPSVAKLGHQYNGLVVRGGSPAENGYFLDNIKVQNINHFPVQGSSEGLLGLFNVDLIKDIEFHPGGFSAVYGNTLSSVTDIRLREGNRDEVDVQLDLDLGGVGGIVEGPLVRDRGSWLLSFRNSFLNVLREVGILDSVVPEYRDIQGKAVFDLSPRHSLGFLLVHGSGKRSWTREEALDNWDDFYGDIASSQTLAGVNWRVVWGNKGYSDTSLSFSSNSLDYGFLQTSTMSPLFTKSASEKRGKVRNLTTLRFNPKHKILFGFEAETFDSAFHDDYSVGHDLVGNKVPETAVRRSLAGRKLDAFVEHHWSPWKLFSLAAGLRSSSLSLNGDLTLSPSLTLSTHVSPKTTLSASVGVYHQNLPEVLLVQNPGFLGLKDLKSVHYNLYFHHSFSEDTRLSLALYLKEYENFPLDRSQPNLFIIDEPVYRFFYYNHKQLESVGRASSYGLEFMVQKKLVNNLYGLVGASVYRSRYSDYFGQWWNRVFDNRYNATIDLGYKPNERWEFSLRWTFVGGMPYTPFKEDASTEAGWGIFETRRVNMMRLPDFNSLDLRFDRRFHFLRSSLILYISVWNVFDTRKPQMILWNEAANSLTSQISLGRVPVFGIELEF